MIIREENLIKLNAKNKIQQVTIKLDQIDNIYQIYRLTGQYGGKIIQQPVLAITSGKVNRTVSEQATLKFNSLLTEYLNSGYKNLKTFTSKALSALSETELKSFFNGGNSDTAGVPKPMLAKSSDDLSPDVFEKDMYVSRKIDGTRMLMYYKDGKVLTSSRGGKDYNISASHICNNPQVIKLFQENPDLILDGEFYKHGWPLQKISGLARLQERTTECDLLEYWVYDIVNDKPFKERLITLQSFENKFPDSVKLVQHTLTRSYLNIKKLHDQYVQEGFEGLCGRFPNKEYGIGKRSGLYLIKLKEFQDAEFEITGLRDGLRLEDMCFTLKTKEGKEFAAKPVGDATLKKYYVEHINDLIGKKATVKFFYYSKDGIPLLPVMKHIRPDDE